MKIGKISESVLKRTIIKEIQYKNKTVKRGAAVGNDGAVFLTDGRDMVSSVSTYTGEMLLCGRRAFAGAVNSVAAKAAKPFAVQVSVLMPESIKESTLRAFMVNLHDMGRSVGVQIAGGHTETVSGIEKPVVTVTAYGYIDKPFEEQQKGRQDKHTDSEYDIVMIGEAGLEGTAVIAIENENELRKRFTAGYIDKAKEYARELVIVREAAAAGQHGERAMHDTSKGGVFGALWELAEYLKCGLEINLRSIPIRQETIELCEYFNLNPYFINSLGGLLVATRDGQGLVNKINAVNNHTVNTFDNMFEADGEKTEADINMSDEVKLNKFNEHNESKFSLKRAAVIGHTVAGHQKTIINNDEKRYLESPRSGKAEDMLTGLTGGH